MIIFNISHINIFNISDITDLSVHIRDIYLTNETQTFGNYKGSEIMCVLLF